MDQGFSEISSYDMYTHIWEMTILKRSTEIEEEKKELEKFNKEKNYKWHEILALGQADTRTDEEIQKYEWAFKLLPDMEAVSNADKINLYKYSDLRFILYFYF